MDFCPRCGKRGTKGMLCAGCATAEQGVKTGKEIVLIHCTGCGKWKFRNRWGIIEAREQVVEKALAASMPKIHDITIINHGIPDVNGPGIRQEIMITAVLDGQEYILPARLTTTLCENCGKRHTKYYEGTLQVRNVRPEILAFIHEQIAENGAVGISKEDEVKGGVDMQLTSQRYLQVLGNKLTRQFGGSLKVNASIFTRDRQTSKDVYRVNVLYTAPHFTVGDVLDSPDGPIRINQSGKMGKNLRTGKNCAISPRDHFPVLPIERARITRAVPHAEVLHPKTYQPLTLLNRELPELAQGEKVRIVVTEQGAFFVEKE